MDTNAKTIFFMAMCFIYLSFPNISHAHSEVGMITTSLLHSSKINLLYQNSDLMICY